MAKFRVGDSSNTVFTIGNSRCHGGTWYSSGDVGISEEVLVRDYPFLTWDEKPKTFAIKQPETPKEIPKPKAKKK